MISASEDTAILSITLSHRRESVCTGKHLVSVREGAILAAVIDKFVNKILEGKCPTPDEWQECCACARQLRPMAPGK